MICSGDGDVPLYLRVADGNEADKAIFAKLMQEFRASFSLDALWVADSALYSADNLKLLQGLRWVSRVPLTVAAAESLVECLEEQQFVSTTLAGYRIVERDSFYGGVSQRWVIVESAARQQADIKQLHSKLDKLEQQLNSQLTQLCAQDFRCEADALLAADRFGSKLKYHCLEAIALTKHTQHNKPGRPRKDAQPQVKYRIQATLERNPTTIQEAIASSGRFVLATNVTDATELSAEEVLQEYKKQQAPERGFRFLKDPLFFANSVFLKSPERVAALAFVMGLCLLVYSLGQRMLRQALTAAGQSINNQLGQPTKRPTLRWIFQCFQDVHLLLVNGIKQIANLTVERKRSLRFFCSACSQYYLLC